MFYFPRKDKYPNTRSALVFVVCIAIFSTVENTCYQNKENSCPSLIGSKVQKTIFYGSFSNAAVDVQQCWFTLSPLLFSATEIVLLILTFPSWICNTDFVILLQQGLQAISCLSSVHSCHEYYISTWTCYVHT